MACQLQRARAARFYRTTSIFFSSCSKDWKNGSGDPALDQNTTLPVSPGTVEAYYEALANSGTDFAVVFAVEQAEG